MATRTKADTKASKIAETKVEAEDTDVRETVKKSFNVKDIDTSQTVMVRNGFNGILVYTSSRTGETFLWDNFGDEQEMELRELRNVKNSAKSFFINNWFVFDDEYKWVIEYLNVGQYYKYTLDIDELEDLLSKSAEEIAETVNVMTAGQKKTLEYMARNKIASGGIDSYKAIIALEKALNVELIEK